jgi:CPA1 family monovalent cation:H+ antiporter
VTPVVAALLLGADRVGAPIASATTGQSDAARTIALVLVLLFEATLLAVVARRLGIPYPVLLVLGGLGLGFIPGLPAFGLEPDVVFLLFLPPILFGAGYFTSIRDLRANIRPIGLLAVGLVLFTTVVVAVVIHALVPTLGWAAAFALGAIVAPPDAAAAFGTFSLVDAAGTFVVASVGGAVVGLVVGYLAGLLVKRINDEVFSIVVTFLAPTAAYLPAEQLGLSGVLATVVAGLWLGRHAPKALSSGVRLSGVAAWQILLFLVNGAVFILIGLSLPQALGRLAGRSPAELLGLGGAVAVAVIVARIVYVLGVLYVPKRLARRGHNDPEGAARNIGIVGWAGMRGVVSLAAALALPADFPERDLLVFLTFAVILATLVGQGLTLPLLIHRLDIDDGAGLEGQEEAYARYIAADAATARLDDLAREWPGHQELIDTLRAQYTHRSHHAELRQDTAQHDDEAEQELLEHRAIRLAVLNAERDALIALRDRGAISDEIFRRVERDLDLEELRMEA